MAQRSQKNSPGKRVIALSRVDRERLERAEIHTPEEAFEQYAYRPPKRLARASQSSDDEPAQHSGCHKAHARYVRTPKAYAHPDEGLTALDREILENVPPHFGKL